MRFVALILMILEPERSRLSPLMLVWLVSYPRSGQLLTRTLLHQTFGLKSYVGTTEGNASVKTESGDSLGAMAGAAKFPDKTAEEFLSRARGSSEIFVTKTHSISPETDRAIYIVRDARPVFVSYRRFVRDLHQQDFPLTRFVEGEHWPGDWSVHVDAYLKRPDEMCLFLRYEDLARNPLGVVPKISSFLEIDPIGSFELAFADFHKKAPKLAPVGDNTPGIQEIEQSCSDLFWRRHGATMTALGYAL